LQSQDNTCFKAKILLIFLYLKLYIIKLSNLDINLTQMNHELVAFTVHFVLFLESSRMLNSPFFINDNLRSSLGPVAHPMTSSETDKDMEFIYGCLGLSLMTEALLLFLIY